MRYEICYLCNREIHPEVKTDDHVVPKQLIKRKQPKVKGFDYAGVLPTHDTCNNQFGSEIYSQKALEIIEILHNEKCFIKIKLIENPNIKVMVLNPACISNFSKQELSFFKIINAEEQDSKNIKNPSYYLNKEKIDLKQEALFVALSVLTKSAAALLVSRHFEGKIPNFWRVLAIPFTKAGEIDLDTLLGSTKPFEVGVKTWIRKLENNDHWFIVYKVNEFFVYLLFTSSPNSSLLEEVSEVFNDSTRLLFEGKTLNELVGYKWKKA